MATLGPYTQNCIGNILIVEVLIIQSIIQSWWSFIVVTKKVSIDRTSSCKMPGDKTGGSNTKGWSVHSSSSFAETGHNFTQIAAIPWLTLHFRRKKPSVRENLQIWHQIIDPFKSANFGSQAEENYHCCSVSRKSKWSKIWDKCCILTWIERWGNFWS